MQRKEYNPYVSVLGKNIDRFQGVFNDDIGTSIPDSSVYFAKNAMDKRRGAIQKRSGYDKYLSKNHEINNIGKVFDGIYIQGDDEVYYRTELLTNFRLRPGWEDAYFDYFSGITFLPYSAIGTLSSSSGSFTATGGYIGSERAASKEPDIKWRYSHIAKAINQRRQMLNLPQSTLPTTRHDGDILYTDINNARGEIEFLSRYFCYSTIDEDDGVFYYTNYHFLLEKCRVGGINPATNFREWRNYNSAGIIEYRNDLIATDLMTSTAFTKYCLEMETCLRNMVTVRKPLDNWTDTPGNRSLLYGTDTGALTVAEAFANAKFRWQADYSNSFMSYTLIRPSDSHVILAVITKIPTWTVNGLSALFAHRIRTYHYPVLQPYNINIVYPPEHWGKSNPVPTGTAPVEYFDFFGGRMPEPYKYYILKTTDWSFNITINGDYSDYRIWNASTFPSTSNKYYWQSLVYGNDINGKSPDYGALVDYRFPEDDKLGTLSE